MRPSGDTARGLVFDDFVDKQVVHVSATSFRSVAERVSMQKSQVSIVFTQDPSVVKDTQSLSRLSPHPYYYPYVLEITYENLSACDINDTDTNNISGVKINNI